MSARQGVEESRRYRQAGTSGTGRDRNSQVVVQQPIARTPMVVGQERTHACRIYS